MGHQPETVKIVYITCNGGSVNSPHRAAVELLPGQRYCDIPQDLYVCEECRAVYRAKMRREQIQNAPVRHDSSNRINRICGDLSDVFKDSN